MTPMISMTASCNVIVEFNTDTRIWQVSHFATFASPACRAPPLSIRHPILFASSSRWLLDQVHDRQPKPHDQTLTLSQTRSYETTKTTCQCFVSMGNAQTGHVVRGQIPSVLSLCIDVDCQHNFRSTARQQICAWHVVMRQHTQRNSCCSVKTLHVTTGVVTKNITSMDVPANSYNAQGCVGVRVISWLKKKFRNDKPWVPKLKASCGLWTVMSCRHQSAYSTKHVSLESILH